jgi:cell division protein FtsN
MVGLVMGVVIMWLGDIYNLRLDDFLPEKQAKEQLELAEEAPNELDNIPIEFYYLLPKMEEKVPDHLISKQIREDSADRPMDKPGLYRLQAGSFQNLKDADRRRANIVLLGLDANIQTVNRGGATWHRVMMGPFESLKHLEVARHRLNENRIETMTIKLKQEG